VSAYANGVSSEPDETMSRSCRVSEVGHTYSEQRLYAARSYSFDQAAKYRPTLDLFRGEVRYGVGRLRRVNPQMRWGAPTVVVRKILREHGTQMSLAGDQHTVAEFGSEVHCCIKRSTHPS
jgi:hypothetical protein